MIKFVLKRDIGKELKLELTGDISEFMEACQKLNNELLPILLNF